MIWKVLKHNIKPGQITGTFLGIMLGLTILMGALSFYLDIKPIFEDKESFWKDEYIIINKKIMLTDTYQQLKSDTVAKPLFSNKELDDIRALPFVKDVAKFTSCSFAISAYTEKDSPLPGIYTILFFESVPDEYIDVNYKNWKWEEGNEFVPAILPKAYLNLYNFGFAQSQNLPQVSEEGARMIKFKVKIEGNGKTKTFETRVVGFSDRINTLLVPKSFVDWGNQNFGSDPNPDAGRIIIIAKDPSSPELAKYIEDHKYDVNQSELSNSKALSFLKVTTTIVLIIGVVIILLAFSLMVISIQLLLHRNNENISKLGMLGYSLNKISLPYQLLVIILFSVTFLTSIIPLSIFRDFYSSNLILLGYEDFNEIMYSVLPPGLLFTTVIVVMLIIMIRRSVKKIIIAD